MTTECIITFVDNEQGIFYPGQILRCNAVLTTQKIKNQVREISVTVYGIAITRWEVKHQRRHTDGSRHPTSTTYTGQEVYISSQNIVQKDPIHPTFDLMPGTYAYNFQIQLPPIIPTSHMGYHGQIFYEVRCTISRSWKFDNIFAKPFTIICPLDLNLLPILKEPVDVTDEKNTICCCCKMSPLKVRARIPTSGYVPGQSIACIVEASNDSWLSCRGITVSLNRHVMYTATFPRWKTEMQMIKISKVILPAVPKSSKKIFVAVLLVPPTPPSSLDTCGLINTSYMIMVNVKTGKCHQNLQLGLPVTIGTTPLIENIPNPSAPSLVDNTNPISHLSLDPPSYESQMSNEQDKKFEQEPNIKYEPFAPKYPVYKNIARSQEELEKTYGGQVFYSTFL